MNFPESDKISAKQLIKLILLATVIGCVVFAGGCYAIIQLFKIPLLPGPGLNDWTYPLINNYEIWHVNSSTITLEYVEHDNHMKSGARLSNGKITQFCYNDRYICVEESQEGAIENSTESQSGSKTPAGYIIVDTEGVQLSADGSSYEHKIYGTYRTKEEVEAKIEELGITGLCQWVATEPAPEGAVFPDI